MTLPTPRRWADIERLLDGALDLAPEERTEWLGRTCATDTGLRAEVERLLGACAAAGPFLEEPAPVAAVAMVASVDVGEVLEPGDRVGCYEIVRELGRGGMATVYLANDLKHDRPVALKALHPEIAAGLGSERFLREIRLTARLQHPPILSVFDSGALEGRPWYTMPYVRGESLRDRLRREVQLPVETAVEITRQVALALEYAHGEGTVHRDIKPENVLLSDGQALVADFGIARAIGAATEESLTEAGVAIGTPSDMAPEQTSGGQVDGADRRLRPRLRAVRDACRRALLHRPHGAGDHLEALRALAPIAARRASQCAGYGGRSDHTSDGLGACRPLQ